MYQRALATNYCMPLVDSHSRYPFAVLLQKVTAQTVCAALVHVFSHTSLPVTITCYNASSNSKLDWDFWKRFGTSPLFFTPLHSSGN
jgi:hypothetical protein